MRSPGREESSGDQKIGIGDFDQVLTADAQPVHQAIGNAGPAGVIEGPHLPNHGLDSESP